MVNTEKVKRSAAQQWLRDLLQGSLFVRLSVAFAAACAGWVKNSAFARMLCAYPADAVESSALCNLLLLRPVAASKGVRRWFAAQVERSAIVQALQDLIDGMLSVNLVSWSAAFMSFGLTLLVVEGVRLVRGRVDTILGLSSGVAVGCLLGGLLCSTCRDSLSDMLQDSAIMNRLLFGFCGLRRSSLAQHKPRQTLAAPLLGVLLGLLTLRLPLFYLLFGMAAVVGAGIVLCVPETGLLLIMLALPFLPTIPLSMLCLYVVGAYAFKLLRCKRTLQIQALDLAVAGFGLVMLTLGGLTSIRAGSSARQVGLYLLYLLVYVTAANLVRGRRLVLQSAACLLTGAMLSSLLGLYQQVRGVESTASWIDTKLFAEIGARIVGPFDNPNVFGEYLILLLPLAIWGVFSGRGMRRVTALVITACMGGALILTWSRGAWLGAFASVGLYLLLVHEAFLRLLPLGLLASPFAIGMLPRTVLSRLLSVGNLADTSTAYRLSIWSASVRMIRDHLLTGIGTGMEPFRAVYPLYALGGAAYALHAHNLYLQIFLETGILGIALFVLALVLYFKWVFHHYRVVTDRSAAKLILSLGMGLFALLLQGLTDNVWFNYRIVLLFWLLMGLTVGIGRGPELDKSEGLYDQCDPMAEVET